MNGMLQAPTAFETCTSVVSAALYLVIGVAALAQWPRDARARTFFTIAIASLVPFLLPLLSGRLHDTGPPLTAAVLATAVSLAVGSVALLHFSQVFPARRPWIQSRHLWLAATYVAVPLAAAIGALALMPFLNMMLVQSGDAGGMGAVDEISALVMLVTLIPTIIVVGIVLPFAALLSLYKSWEEAKREGSDPARSTTLTILISQLAGGVLTILVVPLLHFAAPTGPWATIAAALLFGAGLLFPIAFAIGVWKFRLLRQT